jgi:hypothetical protein
VSFGWRGGTQQFSMGKATVLFMQSKNNKSSQHVNSGFLEKTNLGFVYSTAPTCSSSSVNREKQIIPETAFKYGNRFSTPSIIQIQQP